MALDSDRIEMIAQEITRYLASRTGAADTFDGISRWWLARLRLEEEAADVRAALDRLVERRIVLRTALPDGDALYSSARKEV
jgi:hypothetical protein